MIIDDDINSLLLWPLKEGVTLHAVVDACHGGTILDLAYDHNQEKGIWDDNWPPAKEHIRKHTSGGLAICLGACGDNQMAADTIAISGAGMNGAMTNLSIKVMKENPKATYWDVMRKMHEEIENMNQCSCRSNFWPNSCRTKITNACFHHSSPFVAYTFN